MVRTRKPRVPPALLEEKAKEEAACDRWWKRLQRAFRALEKHSKILDRIHRKIEAVKTP